MPDLEQPIIRRPQEIVENVYPLRNPVTGDVTPIPDIASAIGMEDYLQDRLRPDQEGFQGGKLRVANGVWRIPYPGRDGWRYYLTGDPKNPDSKGAHWRRLAAINLAVNAGLNILNGNAGHLVADAVEEVQAVKDVYEDWRGIGVEIDECATQTTEPTTTTRLVPESFEFNSSGAIQPVGEAVADPAFVDEVLDHIETNTTPTSHLVSGEIQAVSSDDWRTDPDMSGIGHPNDGEGQNGDLAEGRLDPTETLFEEEAENRGIDLDDTEFKFGEVVLEGSEVDRLVNAIRANGFDEALYPDNSEAISAALEIYNARPQDLDESLRATMRELLPRGFRAELTYEKSVEVPGEDRIICKPALVPDGSPEDGNRDYDPWLIPLPLLPYPAFRKKFLERTRWKTINIPTEEPDPEYLKLYPQARTEQDTLVQEAWAYARKYQHLMRDGRIQGSYRLDYVDADGNPQRLRAMFVDHEPTPAFLERAKGLLQTISQMQGGRVGDELDMIAIYPTENAGTAHGDPKKVGIGIDVQKDGVLGTAYPSLRLVEMHMPPNTEADDLYDFNGPDSTFAHEIAGHFTDVNDKDNYLRETGRRLPNGAPIYGTNARIENSMQAQYNRAKREESRGQRTRWTVFRQVRNAQGELVDLSDVITNPERAPSRFGVVRAVRAAIDAFRSENVMDSRDPRLAESMLVVKETGHPSRYGAKSAAEHQAEAAAGELVGEIPFNEAHDGKRITTRPGFAQGYHVSTRDHEALAARWGSDPTRLGVVFTDDNGDEVVRTDWQHWYGKPEDDDELAALMNEARQTPLPDEVDLLHVVTGKRI